MEGSGRNERGTKRERQGVGRVGRKGRGGNKRNRKMRRELHKGKKR